MSIQEHKADIDFRSREIRQADAIQEITDWYEKAHLTAMNHPTDRNLAKLEVLSAVMWLLIPAAKHKALTVSKRGYQPPQSEDDLALELFERFRA